MLVITVGFAGGSGVSRERQGQLEVGTKKGIVRWDKAEPVFGTKKDLWRGSYRFASCAYAVGRDSWTASGNNQKGWGQVYSPIDL